MERASQRRGAKGCDKKDQRKQEAETDIIRRKDEPDITQHKEASREEYQVDAAPPKADGPNICVEAGAKCCITPLNKPFCVGKYLICIEGKECQVPPCHLDPLGPLPPAYTGLRMHTGDRRFGGSESRG